MFHVPSDEGRRLIASNDKDGSYRQGQRGGFLNFPRAKHCTQKPEMSPGHFGKKPGEYSQRRSKIQRLCLAVAKSQEKQEDTDGESEGRRRKRAMSE